MDYNQVKKLYGLLGFGLAAVIICCVVLALSADRTAPVIKIDKKNLTETYSDDMDTSELLKGVTAYDEEDGDVSDSLFVVHMIVLASGDKVKVTYAAKDKSNNIGQEDVVIGYSGNKNYIDVLPDEKILESLTQEDDQQGTQQEETTAEPQNTEPVLGGSGEPVRINQEEVDATGIPQIELKYTDYTLHAGEAFSTVEALDAVNATYDEKESVSNRIVINGLPGVDVNTPGDYALSYSVSDTEGNRSPERILTVHVIP